MIGSVVEFFTDERFIIVKLTLVNKLFYTQLSHRILFINHNIRPYSKERP